MGTKKSKLMKASEAVRLISNDEVVGFCGAGGGITEPTKVIEALAQRFKGEQLPKNLTLIHTTGLGDRNDRGMSPLAQQGMVKRVIGGHWAQSPRLAEMAERNEIEAYNFPQGIVCHLIRAAASKQPGILTHVGLGTFVDPEQTGGRLNKKTTEPLVKKQTIDDKDYLFIKLHHWMLLSSEGRQQIPTAIYQWRMRSFTPMHWSWPKLPITMEERSSSK